jgi:pantetheine-phosphate adenylyltransferase
MDGSRDAETAEDHGPEGKLALFPGTFDPLSNGHLDVILRGQRLFDRLVVAVGRNPAKRLVFSTEERLDMIRQLVAERCEPHVEVAAFTGLTVDYARHRGAAAILRGIRNVTDLNFEFQLALTNRAIADVETVFIMTGEVHAFTSSTLIKQIASGGDIDRLAPLLPPLILERLRKKKDDNGGTVPWAHVDHLKDEE